jgi:hypothetical protein
MHSENASLPLDQDEYQKRYDGLCARFESVKSRPDVVTAQIVDRTGRRVTVEQLATDLIKQDGVVAEFDPVLWHTMVDVVTVYSREDVRFRFKDGTEIIAFRKREHITRQKPNKFKGLCRVFVPIYRLYVA